MNDYHPGHNNETHEGKGRPISSTFHIIVNGRPRIVDDEQISYSQIIELAFPDNPNGEQFLYSVHYVGRCLPDGTLAEGQSVELVNGMKFDVTKTNRS